MKLKMGWYPVLLIVLAVEVLAAVILHRSDDAIRISLEDEAQVDDLFLLSNRGVPEGIDEDFVQRLLSSSNDPVREWIMTTNFSRFADPRSLNTFIQSLDDPVFAFRCKFLLTHQIGRRHDLTLSGLSRYLSHE
jgi:hypothetical protein